MRYGPLAIERHSQIERQEGVYLRIFFNGKDVTNRCQFADDIEGVVTLLKHAPTGEPYVILDQSDDSCGEVAKETLRGDVVIQEGVRA